jgi:hypothetical protein
MAIASKDDEMVSADQGSVAISRWWALAFYETKRAPGLVDQTICQSHGNLPSNHLLVISLKVCVSRLHNQRIYHRY